ncbi:CdaR family protein [Solibaculum mannosilyticum]|uniref:YbbR-like domain-containing protein n=1 Tax=Solibaculum mannosilyticum TaxID=2780922 RepID=A0A7I8D3P0_9FIRM|nr:CdaR family protein [Solibaculum mannosilyticum]BCI60119.1 hypothetical protein C12CBH8_07580 [Solibaculum mannosilyticum]
MKMTQIQSAIRKVRRFFHKLNLGKLFYNNRFVFFFSIIASICLWIGVVFVVSPNTTTTFYDVEVSVSLTEEQIERGIQVVDHQELKLDKVVLTGGRLDVAKVNKSDIKVTASAEYVENPGTYPLTCTVRAPDGVTVFSYEPLEMYVQFDRVVTKTFTVEPNTSRVKAAEGYAKNNMILPAADREVTVSGTETLINQVEKVEAYCDEVTDLQETAPIDARIRVLDSQGNEIEGLEPDITQTQVTVSVIKQKSVPLTVKFSNVPSYYESSQLSYTIQPANTILVGGAPADIDALQEIAVGIIDFRKITKKNHEFDFDLEDFLSSDFTNYDDTIFTSVTVDIDVSNMVEKTVTIHNFMAANTPEGVTASFAEQEVTGVRIIGPREVVNRIQGSDSIVGVVDLKGQDPSPGQMQQNISWIEVDGIGGCWVISDSPAMLTFS